jgi:hypothetical protein
VLGPTGGAAGNFLRDDGSWQAAAGGVATGLTNSQFALMPPSTIKARTGSTGLPEDLVGSGVATLLPLFNNIDKGLVPGSAGGTTAFLRADGAWATPAAGGSVSGLAFNQIQDVSPFRLLGRSGGSGTIQELSPLTVASMLPLFQGSGFGLVPAPTGGVASGSVLFKDGEFGFGRPSGASKGMMQSGISAVDMVTPQMQQHHAGHPKFWLNAKVVAGVPTLSGNYNISSIVDMAIGQFQANFTAPFSGISWSCAATVEAIGTQMTVANGRAVVIRPSGIDANSIKVMCHDRTSTTNLPKDPGSWHLQGWGPLQ